MIPRLGPDVQVDGTRGDQSITDALVQPEFTGLPDVQLADGCLRERRDIGDAGGDLAERDGGRPRPVSPPAALDVLHAAHP